LVEFRSASSKGRWRIKKKIEDRMAVKPKSVDDYVGRPNKDTRKKKKNKHAE